MIWQMWMPEGERQQAINLSEGEMQRRINEAEGRADAIKTIGNATATSIETVAAAISVAGGADDSYSGAHLYDGRPRPDDNLQCTESEGLLMRYGGEFGAAGRSP